MVIRPPPPKARPPSSACCMAASHPFQLRLCRFALPASVRHLQRCAHRPHTTRVPCAVCSALGCAAHAPRRRWRQPTEPFSTIFQLILLTGARNFAETNPLPLPKGSMLSHEWLPPPPRHLGGPRRRDGMPQTRAAPKRSTAISSRETRINLYSYPRGSSAALQQVAMARLATPFLAAFLLGFALQAARTRP